MKQLIAFFLISYTLITQASIPVNGTFQATKSCPAYLSKNNKSNPNAVVLKPNEIYPLREINKTSPDWLRIEMAGVSHPLRWVSTQCGLANYQEESKDHCDKRKGRADAYILALSSQTGFCQTYGYEAGKPECYHLSKDSYQANHLTLHGLWPNQDSCGVHYGYCDVEPKPNHCDYSPLNLTQKVNDDLIQLMPSYKYGSCLERHEWSKHGSCQVLSDNDYFALALRLTKEVNATNFGHYLAKNPGQTVPLSELRQQIDDSFGAENGSKVYLGCKNGVLVDVYLLLPALIPIEEPLDSLINQAQSYDYHDTCPRNVKLSDFHKEAL